MDSVMRVQDWVPCVTEHFSDPQIYNNYLLACQNVSNLFLDQRRGDHCGRVGPNDCGKCGWRHADAYRHCGGACASCPSDCGRASFRGGAQGLLGVENQSGGDEDIGDDANGGERESVARCRSEDSSGTGDGATGGGVVVPGGGVSSSVGLSEVRGKNYVKNKRRRELAREKKKSAMQRCVGADEWKQEVRRSLEERWKAENEAATLRAKQNTQLLLDRDMEQAKRLRRTGASRVIERNMVAMEQSHAKLRATGNVPGFAETVVDSVPGLSSGDCSISPSSSISEAEVRAMQKDLADERAMTKKLSGFLREHGIDLQGKLYQEKEAWTDNSENHAVLREYFPVGYVMDFDRSPVDGKFIPY